jgi:hypothetical protein
MDGVMLNNRTQNDKTKTRFKTNALQMLDLEADVVDVFVCINNAVALTCAAPIMGG